MNKLQLEYLKPESAQRYDFYLIPKLLIDHEAFDNIDYGAKLLYSLMLSRTSLSAKNAPDFTDKEGNLFVIYTVEQIMEHLRCARGTAVKMLKQLDATGLIEKKRQGQGKPSIIYVKDFATMNSQKSNNWTSGNSIIELQEVQLLDRNYNDLKYPDNIYNQSINPNNSSEEKKQIDGLIDEDPYSNYDEHLTFVAEACNFEFNNKQVQVILNKVALISDELEKYRFIKSAYDRSKMYELDNPAGRHNYFLKVLETEIKEVQRNKENKS